MAKIIVFSDFADSKKEKEFVKKLNDKISDVESELGIEDEPLLVLTDEAAINLGNQLIDIKEAAQAALDILNISESEELPWEE